MRLRLEGLEDRCVPSISTLAAAQQFIPSTNSLVEVSFQLDQSGNVWEYNPTLGTTGVNGRLVQLSTSKTGQWSSITATIGADGNPALFAINKANGSLWEHSLVFGDKDGSGATATEGEIDLNWREISSGNFVEISATTAAVSGGDAAVVFGIVSGGTLWEHSTAFGDLNAQGAVTEAGQDLNWRELSSNQFTHLAAAQVTFPPSAAAGAGGFAPLLQADPVVFAIGSNGGLWEHNANLTAGQTGAAPRGRPTRTSTRSAAARLPR